MGTFINVHHRKGDCMNYSFYLTDSCNLNCKYCYEKNMHFNRELSLENMKKIIDREIQNKSKEVVFGLI